MVNIVYSGNKSYFKGILLSCMSMLEKCDDVINIYILTMDVTEKNKKFIPITQEQVDLLTKVLKRKNINSKGVLLDLTTMYKNELSKGKNSNTEYSPYTMLRLFLDKIDNIPDKILYLDVDTMVKNDIRELYNIDIDKYEFGAVLDYMGKFWIGKNYTNAGVLLLNMKKIKETQLFERSREMVKTKWLKLPDQDALNRLVKDKMYLPDKYNEQRTVKDDTVVKHFCKGIIYFPIFHIYNVKQWDIENVHKKLKIHDFDKTFAKYECLCKDYDINA